MAIKTSDGKWMIKYRNIDIKIYTGGVNNNLLRIMNICSKNFIGSITILAVTDNVDKNLETQIMNNYIKECILLRYIERIEYERIINYAIASSKIQSTISPYSNLLQIATSPFNIKKFSNLFPLFSNFLKLTQKLNLMISGSCVLYSLDDIELRGWAADVDIYIYKNQDYIETLKKIDKIIRQVYNKPSKYKYIDNHDNCEKEESVEKVKIHLVRSPYILSWMIVADNDEILDSKKKKKKTYERQETKHRLIASYQVVLSPCSDWSHVFAGYHSDIVCAGYLTKEQKFVETPDRFLHWYNNKTGKLFETFFPELKVTRRGKVNNVSRIAYFFPDLVSPRYRDRVNIACRKYLTRGLKTVYVSPFDEIEMADVARSQLPWQESNYAIEKIDPIDICPSLVSILNKEGVSCISESFADVYYGEKFRTIIETMSCFQACPTCDVLVFNAKKSLYCDIVDEKNIGHYTPDDFGDLNDYYDIGGADNDDYNDVDIKDTFIMPVKKLFKNNIDDTNEKEDDENNNQNQKNITYEYDKGCFCDDCFQLEIDKMTELKETLRSIDPLKKCLVTGGRCGLGQKVLELLKEHKVTAIGTTRFPSINDNLIKLDLKDATTWTPIKNMLENGEINYLLLSASETLHYPDDDSLSKDWNLSNHKVDWTNDFKRDNSGVWHKCLNEHSYNEIVSPLMANVVGNASILAFFLNGVQKMRSIGNNQDYCCIVVTSFEASFNDKTPFHPITNACKAALEQIVITTKSQCEFLDCKILLADPGWVYTEGSFGKLKGPVPIDFGACQILQPLVHSIKNKAVNGQLFRRSQISRQYIETIKAPIKSFKIKLSPCNHIVDQEEDGHDHCPECFMRIKSRELINDRNNHKKYALNTILNDMPRDLNKLILDYDFK